MNERDFEKLVDSAKQAGASKRGAILEWLRSPRPLATQPLTTRYTLSHHASAFGNLFAVRKSHGGERIK